MSSILSLSLLLALAAPPPPMPHYPDLDQDKITSRLVVVEVVEQDYLPTFDACDQPDVVCMDPPPTWFRARLLEQVHGDAPPAEFFAATTSHYGPTLRPDEGRAPSPLLMVLASDGQHLVMPRYSNAPVFRDSIGEFHLVVQDEDMPRWLPCGVSVLVAPINDDALAKSAAVSLVDQPRYDDGWDAEFFRVDKTHAYPRFSIPVRHLSQWLAAGNGSKDLRCNDEDEDGP
jgi:hypothetical protein